MRITLWGIGIKLHRTWYVAFVLILVVIVTQFPEAYPMWTRILLGMLGSLLFLLALIIRQLALNLLT